MTSEQRDFGTEISGNRQRNHEFTPEQRAAMVSEVYAGKSMRQAAESYNTDPATVYRTKKRWQEHHNNTSRPRKGCPKKLTGLQIVRITIYNPPFDSPTLSSSKKKIAPPKFVNFTYTKFGQNK
ncbi:hypothetical protein DER44DRAFT_110101 [Fusarium oxysporum]|nr:hypothetical protein DER44DRAFT_110101 [Fusarium oxysporum]